jgi:hypothetical protein
MPKSTIKPKTTKVQREQQALLAEALKQPGVATAIATYSQVQQHSAPVMVRVERSGYALGGNA